MAVGAGRAPRLGSAAIWITARELCIVINRVSLVFFLSKLSFIGKANHKARSRFFWTPASSPEYSIINQVSLMEVKINIGQSNNVAEDLLSGYGTIKDQMASRLSFSSIRKTFQIGFCGQDFQQ